MTTTTTTASAIENLAKNQTIVLHTTTGDHILLAKPFFNILHQCFPDASFEVLEILLSKNAIFALHIAKKHYLLPLPDATGSMQFPEQP